MKEHILETIKLENLLFDPNNYRLRSNKNYKYISEKDISSSPIQQKTMKLITGEGNVNIQDLMESFKSNGYLKVDNILVKKADKNKYLVIEGNRRIATLNVLKKEQESGNDIGELNKSIFKNGIEVIIHEIDDDYDYLILMGLKHVSGNKKWDRYNQAKLLFELKNNFNLNEGDIAKRIGIFKEQVQKDIRGYIAVEKFIEHIKDSNYGTKYNPFEKLMIFIEVTNKPKIRKWIGWNDEKSDFENKKNMERFFSWITPGVEYDEDSEKYISLDPIIVNHKEIRDLDEIIDDEESLIQMEENRDFKFALDQNVVYSKKQFSNTIKKVEKILSNIRTGTSLNMSTVDKKVIKNIISLCQKLLKD